MLTSAEANGEAGLAFTDRVLLRALTGVWISILTSPKVVTILGSFTYDSQGKPSWADSTLSQTGMTLQQNMLYIFQLVQANSGPATQDVVNKLNSVLPSNLTQVRDPQDWATRVTTLTTANPDPTMVWFFKFILIGPAYLAWLAENKYKLDPTFMAVTLTSPAPASVSISPASMAQGTTINVSPVPPPVTKI